MDKLLKTMMVIGLWLWVSDAQRIPRRIRSLLQSYGSNVMEMKAPESTTTTIWFGKSSRLLGSRELKEVLPSDPMFQNQDTKKRGIFKELLRGLHGLLEREHDEPMDEEYEDFEFDYNFRYLQKSLEPAMFDIRDEACMPVGGFRHGDVVECPDLTDPSVVIGVRPDRQGRARLWMHVEGSPGAGVFQQQHLIRMRGRVTGKRQVVEYQGSNSQFLWPGFHSKPPIHISISDWFASTNYTRII